MSHVYKTLFVFLLLSVAPQAFALALNEDFDNGSYTGMADTIFGLDFHPNLNLVIDGDCYSSPRCVQRGGSGSVYYAFVNVGNNPNGYATIRAKKETLASNFIRFALESDDPSGDVAIRWATSSIAYETGLGTVYFVNTTTVDTWYTFKIEWRSTTGDFLETKATVLLGNTELGNTDWQESAMLETSDRKSGFGFGKSTGAGVYPFVDNYTMVDAAGAGSVEDLTGFNSSYNTRFIPPLTITGTSSPTFEVGYYIDENEVDVLNALKNPTLVRFAIANEVTGDNIYAQGENLNGYGTSSASTTFASLADGNYSMNISFANQGTAITGIKPFPDANVYVDFVVSGGLITEVSSPEFYDSTVYEETTQCSLVNIVGCFSVMLNGLFVPDDVTVSQFATLWEQIKFKPPFGYVNSALDLMADIDNDAVAEVDLTNIPFITAIFDPLKLLLGGILWFIYGIWFYNRMVKLEL